MYMLVILVGNLPVFRPPVASAVAMLPLVVMPSAALLLKYAATLPVLRVVKLVVNVPKLASNVPDLYTTRFANLATTGVVIFSATMDNLLLDVVPSKLTKVGRLVAVTMAEPSTAPVLFVGAWSIVESTYSIPSVLSKKV